MSSLSIKLQNCCKFLNFSLNNLMKSTNILTNSCRTLSVLLLKPDLISLTKFDSKKFKSLFLRSNCDDFFKNN